MARTKIEKLQDEIDKARMRLVEQQARIKELESKKSELENMEIVDIVRGMSIPLDELAAALQSLKSTAAPAARTTSGQVDPKPTAPKIITAESGKEDETE